MEFPDYEPTAPNFIRSLTAHYADNPMIVLDDQRLSYAEADAESARMASGLLDAGVGKGTHVGMLLPNGPDWVTTWLAITRIGAIAVPFNTFFQGRELVWMLDHADVEVFVTAASFLGHDYLERLESSVAGLAEAESHRLQLTSLPFLRSVYVVGECERRWAVCASSLSQHECEIGSPSRARLDAAQDRVRPADPMMILYSSGSTADPKGAVHSQGTIIRHSYNLLSTRDLRSEDRIWSPMPFFWVGGFVFSLLGSLHTGACILCEKAFDPEQTLLFLERERATIAAGWPPRTDPALPRTGTRDDRSGLAAFWPGARKSSNGEATRSEHPACGQSARVSSRVDRARGSRTAAKRTGHDRNLRSTHLCCRGSIARSVTRFARRGGAGGRAQDRGPEHRENLASR